jgi:hypothetical protein
MIENEEFQALVEGTQKIANNEKFRNLCNPDAFTYLIDRNVVERVILAYGLLLDGMDKNENRI